MLARNGRKLPLGRIPGLADTIERIPAAASASKAGRKPTRRLSVVNIAAVAIANTTRADIILHPPAREFPAQANSWL
jgi:hypothetical protein